MNIDEFEWQFFFQIKPEIETYLNVFIRFALARNNENPRFGLIIKYMTATTFFVKKISAFFLCYYPDFLIQRFGGLFPVLAR